MNNAVISEVLKFVDVLRYRMLVEKALGKLEKACGGDAIETRWYEMPVYEFTLYKEVSEVTVVGHDWEWQDGEVVVYRGTDSGWANETVYPLWSEDMAMKSPFATSEGFEDVASVSGVEDVEEDEIGVTRWDIEVDVAAGTIVSVEESEERF